MQLDLQAKNGQGFEFMQEVIRAIPKEMEDSGIIQDALNKSAQVTTRKIKSNASVFKDRTGRLRKSIKWRKGRPEFGDTALVSAGGKGARQAWLVERGHGGPKPTKSAHPFAFPAVVSTEQARATAFIREVNRSWKVDVEKPAVLKARTRTRSKRNAL